VQVSGTSGADSLTGSVDADVLDGGAGADTLVGGLGDDLYIVDNLSDQVVETEDGGFDTVQTSRSWIATVGSWIERIVALGTASLNLTGNSRPATLEGNDAINTLDDGGGADVLKGFGGNDAYVVRNAATQVVEAAGGGLDSVRTTLSSYSLTDNVENLTFIGTGGFSAVGNSLGNVITGGSGNDRLDGGGGADRLIGGLGDDVYVVDNLSDTVIENAGEGNDVLITRLNSDKARTNVESLVFGGTGNFAGYASATGTAVTGGAGTDSLYGGISNDTLDGGTGADSMVGGAGDDLFLVDNTGDKVIELAGEGRDTVRTALARYGLTAEVETLVYLGTAAAELTGNAQSNRITGGAAADTLTGLEGDDTLEGGAGADSMTGGSGDDAYTVDDVGDRVIELAGQGNDRITTSLSRLVLASDVEGLTYSGKSAFEGTGNSSANSITGGVGRDRLSGLDGADTLSGGRGDDILDGGSGSDLALYSGASTRYVITPDGSGGFYIQDRDTAAGEGRDRLVSVETLSFADGFFAAGDLAIGATLIGTEAANTLIGGRGDDTLIGFGGADLILGGAGDDLAIFSGEQASYAVYADGGSGFYFVEQPGDGSSGVRDRLVDVERVLFADGTFAVADLVQGVLLQSGPGNATLTGGSGVDAVVYDGPASRYGIFSDGETGLYVEDLTGDGGRDWLNGVETLIFTDRTGDAADFVQGVYRVGSAAADSLVGGAADERLWGGAGDDTLVGGDGIDTAVYGGPQSQYRVYADGLDLYIRDTAAVGRDGVDRLTGIERLSFTDGTVEVAGLASGVVRLGGAADDLLVAGPESTLFRGGGGSDTLVGGAGYDVALFAGPSGRYSVKADGQGGFWVEDALAGAAGEGLDRLVGVESLQFSDGARDPRALVLSGLFAGTGEADTLVGSAGNDTLQGLEGEDTAVFGGPLARYSIVPDGAGGYWVRDSLAGPSGDGLDRLTGVEWLVFADGRVETAAVASGAALTGGTADDSLVGARGKDTLDGGAGADTLVGGDGDDLYTVAQPGDVIIEQPGGGRDTVLTALGRYELAANVEDLTFTGEGAFVGIGNDLDNVLTGGWSTETLIGGGGDDTYVTFFGPKTIVETADGGIDTVVTNTNFVLGDNIENLRMSGAGFRGAHLTGVGNGLANLITGSLDDQVLIGMGGDDTLTGGGGDDTFVFAPGFGRDVITDFTAGDGGDQVRLNFGGLATLVDLQARMTQVDGDVVLALSETDQITFRGARLEDFTLDNFRLTLDRSGLTLAFADEFNSLDFSNGVSGVWQTSYAYVGAGALPSRTLQGTGEQQIYVDPAYAGTGDTALGLNPFSITDGILNIRATATTQAQKDKLYGYDYVSGLLTSQSSFAQTYGYYEMRAKLPAASGAWPAFWLLPSSGTSPPEIDILEAIGINPDASFVTLHDALLPGRVATETAYTQGAATSFHTYGLLWSDTDIVWYIDGVEVLRVATPADLHQPMYMLVNLAVGGGFGGGFNVPDAAALAASPFQIDYIRAYAIDGLTVADSSAGLALDNRVSSTQAGGTGNDTFLAGAGFRTAFGGSAEMYGRNGIDKVIYSGARADYDIYSDGNGGYFVNVPEAWRGADHLSSVEYIQFSDMEGRLVDLATGLYVQGSPWSEVLTGGAAPDIVVGHASNDTLQGLAGSDTLYGGGGNDSLVGGLGVDTAFFSGLATDYQVTLLEGGALRVKDLRAGNFDGVDTLTGVEVLRFSDKTVVAPGALYTFAAAGGVLTYDPASNIRTITGGAGLDVLSIALPVVANGPALAFTVSPDGKTLLAELDGDGVSDLLVSGVEDLAVSGRLVTFAGDFSATGLAPHTIHYAGTSGGDLLDASALISFEGLDAQGFEGNDTLKGGAGRDTLSGGEGSDTLRGGAGDDLLYGGAGVDSLHVADGSDTAYGGEGNDFFWYGVDADRSPPRIADTVIDGGAGIDTLDLGLVAVGLSVDLAARGRLQDIGFGRLNLTSIENVAGGTGADRLSGDAENNALTGREGDDTLSGGAGDDTLQGGAGDDRIDGGGGTDTLTYLGASAGVSVSLALLTAQDTGGDGVDTLKSIEILIGTAFADSLTGGSGGDTLNGGLGNDTLDGGGGGDSLVGGAGDDVYRVDTSRDVIVESFGSGYDTVVTSTSFALATGLSIEELRAVFGTTAINLTGNAYAQVLVGNAGVNLLDGQAGADTMIGGAGNDIYIVDSATDVIVELADEGYDTVRTTAAAYTLGAEIEALTYTGSAAFRGTGNGLANLITGGNGVDVLDGGGGVDRLVGGLGNDTYVVDNVADAVIEGLNEGLDTVRTSVQAYALAANVENLTFSGTGGFQGFGNSLSNVITGGAGSDVLDGRGGADRLIGGQGDDVYYVDHSGDTVVELAGQGWDRILTSLGSARAQANVEELLYVGTGNFQGFANASGTWLYGGAGNDTLTGAAGADLLSGKGGADVLTGGGGADRFYFDGPGLGVDRIIDFQVGVDQILLSGTSFGITSLVGLATGASTWVPETAAGEAVLRYDNATGALYVDATGGDASDQIQIALLGNRAALTLSDIILA